jgi:hypothetical protein
VVQISEPPVVEAVLSNKGPCSGGTVFEIRGKKFLLGDESEQELFRAVRVGGRPAEIINWTRSSIFAKSPEGEGSAEVVVVQVAKLISREPSEMSNFSYNAPTITSWGPKTRQTFKAGKMTIDGDNFGSPACLSDKCRVVKLGHRMCKITAFSYTRIECNIPHGSGKNLPVTLRVKDQTVQLGTFSYNPPTIHMITWDSGRTEGGKTMIVNGTNFGPFEAGVGAQNVTIRSKFPKTSAADAPYFTLINNLCEVTSITHSTHFDELRCTTPPGMGNNLDVILDISGQIVNGVGLFSYGRPLITEVSPNQADADRDVILTISGINFGQMPSPNLHVFVGDRKCENAYWVLYSAPVVRCKYRGGQAVGPQNMQIKIAFQESNQAYDSQNPLFKTECKNGFFGLTGENCTKCSVGSYCAGGDSSPVSTEGFWLWRRDKADSCIPSAACMGNNTCRKEYHNDFCSQCKTKTWCEENAGQCDHYGFYRFEGKCLECPEGAVWRMFGILLFGCSFAALMSWIYVKLDVELMVTSIAIDFFQVLALFAQIGITWPDPIPQIFGYFSFLNFNPEIIAPECTISMPYEAKWYLSMAVPFILFCSIGSVHFFVQFVKPYFTDEGISEQDLNILSRTTSVWVSLATVFYLSVTKKSLEIFDCISQKGKLVLRAAPLVVCGEPNGVHSDLKPWAYTALVMYGIGVPSLFAFVLVTNSKKVRADQHLRMLGMGNTKASNPNWTFRKKYYQIYYRYKPERWWWFIILFVRKFLFASVLVLLDRSEASSSDGNGSGPGLFQAAGGLLVLFVCYTGQVRFRPYIERDFLFEDEDSESDDDEAEELLKETSNSRAFSNSTDSVSSGNGSSRGSSRSSDSRRSTFSTRVVRSISQRFGTMRRDTVDGTKSSKSGFNMDSFDSFEQKSADSSDDMPTRSPSSSFALPSFGAFTRVRTSTMDTSNKVRNMFTKTQKAVQRTATNSAKFVNDLNLLESVLLFSSVTILLSGMMLHATSTIGTKGTKGTVNGVVTVFCLVVLGLCTSHLFFLVCGELIKGYRAAIERELVSDDDDDGDEDDEDDEDDDGSSNSARYTQKTKQSRRSRRAARRDYANSMQLTISEV